MYKYNFSIIMKRKTIKSTGDDAPNTKKLKSNGEQSLTEGVEDFESRKGVSGRFNAKLFRKKLNENDFITGKLPY